MNRIIMYFVGEFAFYLVAQTLQLLFKIPKLFKKLLPTKQKKQSKSNQAEEVQISELDESAQPCGSGDSNGNCLGSCCGITDDFHNKLRD